MDDWDGIGVIIGITLVIVVIAFVIYCIIMIASVLAMVAGGAGIVWGGGTAVANYARSFKENMIDSNRAPK